MFLVGFYSSIPSHAGNVDVPSIAFYLIGEFVVVALATFSHVNGMTEAEIPEIAGIAKGHATVRDGGVGICALGFWLWF